MNIAKKKKKKERQEKKICMEMDHSVGRKKGLLGDQIARYLLRVKKSSDSSEKSLPGLKGEVVGRDTCSKTAWELE